MKLDRGAHGARAERLAALLEAPPLPTLGRLAAAHAAPVHIVGGAVRDALLGRPAADLDIVVAERLPAFVDAVADAAGRRPSPIGDRWRDTHRMRWKGIQVDVARLVAPLEEDLRQRDFTVNAMALPLAPPTGHEGSLDGDAATTPIDPCGGVADLDARLLRPPAEEVLDEDPLRMLRAVRYATVLDGFELAEELRRAIGARTEKIRGVARERIQTEWRLILEADRWERGVRLANELELAAETLVAVGDESVVRAFAAVDLPAILPEELRSEAVVGRLAALLWEAAADSPAGQLAQELVERRWPPAVAGLAAQAASWSRMADDASEETLARWALRNHRAAALAATLAGAVARARAGSTSRAAEALHSLARRAVEPRWVTGSDLLALGLREGPRLGRMLDELALGQLTRRWSRREGALAWARGQVREEDSGS